MLMMLMMLIVMIMMIMMGSRFPKSSLLLVAYCLFPFIIRQFRPIFIQGRRRFHLLCFRHECGELGKIRQVTHVTSAKCFSQISQISLPMELEVQYSTYMSCR